MRKRYSRSYTVLSFLTMFSYREQPFRLLLLKRTNYIVRYDSTVAVYFTSGRYHFKVTVFGAVLKSSTVFPFASRSDLSVLAGKSALSVMEEGASIK